MKVRYRPIVSQDKKVIKKLAAQAFGVLGSLAVGLETGGWIAEGGDAPNEPIGAIVLKRFAVNGEPLGLVSWIMTHPEARGLGVAAELHRLGDQWFADHGIRRSFAMIEYYNQSSSKLFAGNRYRALTMREQVALFGVRIAPIWIKTLFLVSLSHALWYRDTTDAADTTATASRDSALPKGGFLKALFFQALVFAVLIWRRRVGSGVGEIMQASLAVTGIILIARTVPFWIAARLRGLRTVYGAWSGGAPLAIAVSAITGGFLPFPGSLYPRQGHYSYKAVLPALGFGSLMGAVGLVGLLAAVRLVHFDPGMPPWVLTGHAILRAMVPAFVIVDVLIPFFPFWGYLGRQIYLWKPPVWAAVAAITVGVLAATTLML